MIKLNLSKVLIAALCFAPMVVFAAESVRCIGSSSLCVGTKINYTPPANVEKCGLAPVVCPYRGAAEARYATIQIILDNGQVLLSDGAEGNFSKWWTTASNVAPFKTNFDEQLNAKVCAEGRLCSTKSSWLETASSYKEAVLACGKNKGRIAKLKEVVNKYARLKDGKGLAPAAQSPPDGTYRLYTVAEKNRPLEEFYYSDSGSHDTPFLYLHQRFIFSADANASGHLYSFDLRDGGIGTQSEDEDLWMCISK